MKYILILFMLFESSHMITLPTDPIHREDYRGAVKWITKTAKYEDSITPMEPEFSYYGGKRSIGKNFIIGSGYPKRVFVMANFSMMAANNAKDLKRYQESLPGFHMEKMVKFGGEDGHTVVYVFRRNK